PSQQPADTRDLHPFPTRRSSDLSLIAALRDRSLVAAEECGERMRYRMLESLRVYARAQLADPEWGELAGRHARYYRALAEEAERSEEHTSELQSPYDLVCRLLLE